ncbi:MAG TPA: FKBP-type peptidyl-prolyl cis-trans isomerase, partial [Labilithrix sp.]|nr:FKBP-type peptidyl-prolyl cis-trans isomerase [Labilithrix sp.]
LDNHTHKALIEADEQATAAAGVGGTPAFFVGPYYVSGAQPYGKFRKLVDLVLNPPPTPPSVASAPVASSSLVSKDLAVGTGPEVKVGDKVKVHYTGTLTDGTEFDSSRPRGTPFTFEVGRGVVIKGWDQGLVGMKVGGKRRLTIGSDFAYGDRGVPPKIPPKSTLVFDIELLAIE